MTPINPDRRMAVYNCVKDNSEAGITRFDIGTALNLNHMAVYRVLKALEEDGLVKTWRSHDRAALWEITQSLEPINDTRKRLNGLPLTANFITKPSQDPSPLTLAFDYALGVVACRESSEALLTEAHNVLARILRQYADVVNLSNALVNDYSLWSAKERAKWLPSESDLDLMPIEMVSKLEKALYDRLKSMNAEKEVTNVESGTE